jgi:HK97 family phage major capsid protein
MAKRLAGRCNLTVALAVIMAMLSVVDVKTKAVFDRLARVREAKLCGLSLLDAWRVSAMPAIAGGDGTTVEDQVAAAITKTLPGLLDEKLAPVTARLDTLDKRVGEVDGRVGAVDTKVGAFENDVVRYDATGKRFKWAGGEAPAQVSRRGGESQPLMVSHLWRAVMAGGMGNRAALETFAPEELKMADRLRAAGYQSEHLGSVLFPLGPELVMDPVDEKGQKTGDLSTLRKELGERLRLSSLDPGEIGWLAKRRPEAFGLERKDLALGDDTLGGYLVPSTQAGTVFDLFRARSTVMRAGATMAPLPPSGNITYPRLTADPSFSWADPDSTSDASTSNIGLGVVRLIAKSLRGYVTIPNDLLRYSSPSVELLVRAALAAKAAVGFDDAALQGPGSSLQPKGLINYSLSSAETPAVGKLTLHNVTSNTFEPEDVMKVLGLYALGDDPDQATGWIMRPLMWAAIANRRSDAATANDKKGPFMFWTSRGQLAQQVPEALGGYPVFVSSKVSKTRGGGTNTFILFGNFARLLVGMSGAIELAVSEHVKFLQDKTIIRAVLRGDAGPSHEQSFVFTDDVAES